MRGVGAPRARGHVRGDVPADRGELAGLASTGLARHVTMTARLRGALLTR